ncbi:uncharacterized protein LOC136085283 [Hydra vulgaris]|uniref:Uncharacterized protein LOC136085283 n=1 Tax=Hydra vulgaris TaxID=6087 RepID=A0ABM4CLI1_HYDVU
MILYKRKNSKHEYGDNFPPGSIFRMTPKRYITKEELCIFLRHFNQHRLPEKALLIFDGICSHLDIAVIEEAKKLNIHMLRLPAHCSHEHQPLEKSIFKPLKTYWNVSIDNFRRNFPGRSLSKLQFPLLFTEVWLRTATPANAISGFRSTGIYSFNPNIIPQVAFAPSENSNCINVNNPDFDKFSTLELRRPGHVKQKWPRNII